MISKTKIQIKDNNKPEIKLMLTIKIQSLETNKIQHQLQLITQLTKAKFREPRILEIQIVK